MDSNGISNGSSKAVLIPTYSTVFPVVSYAYGAGRRLSPTSLSQPTPAGATDSLFPDDARLVNAEEWLLRLDYSASKASGSPDVLKLQKKRLDLVIRILIRVLPDVSGSASLRRRGTKPNPDVEFETPYGWVPLPQLGYGYRTMIAWMVDFTSRMVNRYPDTPDPLAQPAVVLVDEIDLHLHPKWQRELIGFLTERFPNTQFIATAHRPLIVQAAGDANIALLRREGDHVVIENDPEMLHGWSVDRSSPASSTASRQPGRPTCEDLLQERKRLLDPPQADQGPTRRSRRARARIGSRARPVESFHTPRRIAREYRNGSRIRLRFESYGRSR